MQRQRVGQRQVGPGCSAVHQRGHLIIRQRDQAGRITLRRQTVVLRQNRLKVIGASRASQIVDNVGALRGDALSADELAEIDRIVAG